MEELVKDGSIRYIGVSNFSVRQTEEARHSLSANEIVSNQVEYSLANRDVESDILPYCQREKVALIAYSPLDRGHIADSLPEELLTKYRMTSAQVMLNWVTRSERVVAIPKASNLSHVEENAESVRVRFKPDEYELISKS